jgi:hypothetical protein
MKLSHLAAPFRSFYWKYRQRGLALPGWADFPADQLDGASVAVVGSAGYLADLAQGPMIDAHDWVLRVDCFWHRGLESAVGRRTDVRLTDFASPPSESPSGASAQVVSTLPNDAGLVPGAGPGECRAERITRGVERLGFGPVYVPERDWVRGKRRQLGHVPGPDAMAILFALEFLAPRCGPIFLTGFTLFQDADSAGREPDLDGAPPPFSPQERELLLARLNWPLRMGSVRLDPVSSWPLRRPAARRAA